MKKSVTMITLLLLIVGMLSGCGNDSNGNRQDESVQIAEPTTDPEAEEIQLKSNVAQDVLLSYDYDSNGELSKITFEFLKSRATSQYTPWSEFSYPWEWKAEEFNVTYDEGGYLKSIETKQYETGLAPEDLAIKADYNADGQIISLTAKYFAVGFTIRDTYNCEVVYNSDDIKVNISLQESATPGYVYNENRIYDTNYNLISIERIYGNCRSYMEYTNGILSHNYEYDNSTGQLLFERTFYDNGEISEFYHYDSETGDLIEHYRYDKNGEQIN